MPVVMAAEQVARTITRIAHEVADRHRTLDDLALIGIRTAGAPIARRLADELHGITGVRVPTGALDITLYRDDLMRSQVRAAADPAPDRHRLLHRRPAHPPRRRRAVHRTHHPAALDALIDFGRPRAIELVVLVDRGHRELPIKADYVGRTVPTSPGESVQVRLAEVEGRDEVVIDDGPDR